MFPTMENQLEGAARKTLVTLTGSSELLKPLYLQPDRAIFLAEGSGIVLKVYSEGRTLQHEYAVAQKAQAIGVPIPELLALEVAQPTVLAMKRVVGKPLSSSDTLAAQEAGSYLERFHAIPTAPPFSGGQSRWDEFILWWANLEIGNIEKLHIFAEDEINKLKAAFERIKPALAVRPIGFLHGDLQAAHILIDSQTQKVAAFLDFADAQPGDPLLDIAVLSLSDHRLADLVLEGYTSIENDEQTQQLLAHYRLLRLIAEVPWLLNRGFQEMAEYNIRVITAISSQKM
jgi:aminoglycoside phosphotransferase (APT) family kinase protein